MSLIFVGKGCQQKIFSNKNFTIYGTWWYIAYKYVALYYPLLMKNCVPLKINITIVSPLTRQLLRLPPLDESAALSSIL